MKAIRGTISAILSLVLALLLVLGCAVTLAGQVVSGKILLDLPATWIRDVQVSEMEKAIDDLADTYGFDREAVKKDFDREALEKYGAEVREFLQSLFTLHYDEEEGTYEEDLIFPYYMWENGEDMILSDEGFQARVDEYDRRLTVRDNIVPVLEKKAQTLVFPLRPQLVITGFTMAQERVDIIRAASWLRYWWVIPCAALVVLFLLILVNRPRWKQWTGCGLIGGSLILLCLFGAVKLLSIAQTAGMVNALFATYLSNLYLVAGLFGLMFILPGILVGCLLLRAGRRAA